MRAGDRRWHRLGYLLAISVAFLTFDIGKTGAQTPANVAEGVLSVIWGDPAPGILSAGHIRFNLALSDGTTLPLQVDPARHMAAIGGFGKRVRVHGQPATDRSGNAQFVAESIELAEPDAPMITPRAPVTKRVLHIVVRFSGDTQTPHAPSFYRSLTNPLTGDAGKGIPSTINGFFNKTSHGKLRWSGDVAGVGGLNPTVWLTLPKTKAQYAPCGWEGACANLTTLANDATNAAVAAGVDVSVYDNLSFNTNNDLDCCAWGGGFSFGGKFYGATWEPPWSQETSVFVHEFGHSLGLPHSGWRYFAYDSAWDAMSGGSTAQSMLCGSYNSANSGGVRNLFCTEPGATYIAPYKSALGWIPAANQVVVNSVSVQTVALAPNAAGLTSAIKMVKICIAGQACTGPSAHYLTVEARSRTPEFDQGLPGEGVIIHDFRANRGPVSGTCFFNSSSGWAMPIDAIRGDYNSTTCTGTGLDNAQYSVGTTYNNSTAGVRVRVLHQTWSGGYVVRVTRTK